MNPAPSADCQRTSKARPRNTLPTWANLAWRRFPSGVGTFGFSRVESWRSVFKAGFFRLPESFKPWAALREPLHKELYFAVNERTSEIQLNVRYAPHQRLRCSRVLLETTPLTPHAVIRCDWPKIMGRLLVVRHCQFAQKVQLWPRHNSETLSENPRRRRCE